MFLRPELSIHQHLCWVERQVGFSDCFSLSPKLVSFYLRLTTIEFLDPIFLRAFSFSPFYGRVSSLFLFSFTIDCSSECSVESGPDEVSASVTERQQSSGFSNPSSQSTEAEVESKRREVLESQERSLSNFDTADWESSTQSDKAGDSACSISKTQSHSSTLKRAKHVRSSANHNSKAVVMTSPSESACSYDAAYPFLSSENIYDWLNNVSTPSCSPVSRLIGKRLTIIKAASLVVFLC